MKNLTQTQKQWLAWGFIAVLLTALSVGLGVQFPVPDPPPYDFTAADAAVALGTTHFTNIQAGDITATGNLAAYGSLTAAGNLIAAGSVIPAPQAPISVTNGAPITPTGAYQPLESAGTVTPTLATAGYAPGALLTLVNTSDTLINLADAETLKLAAAAALGQHDTLTLLFDGDNWIEISRADN